MFTPEEMFDALLDKAAEKIAADTLFGELYQNRAVLHEKLRGRAFSLLYLEVPLMGEPGFDFHIVYDVKDLSAGVMLQRRGMLSRPFAAPENDFLDWYTREKPDGDGPDIVYDLRDGLDLPPMVYLKMSDCTPDFDSFFAKTGDKGAAARLRDLWSKLPPGWHPWYTGEHGGRKGKPLRIGSALAADTQKSYAKNIGLFAEVLAKIGFHARPSPMMLAKLEELFSFPFAVDVQLDALEDSSVGDVLGISLMTNSLGRNALVQSFADGDMKDVMLLLEEWGGADDRWKLLPKTTFSVSRIMRSATGERGRFILSGSLNFVKVRFQGAGALALDAKAYICLGAARL